LAAAAIAAFAWFALSSGFLRPAVDPVLDGLFSMASAARGAGASAASVIDGTPDAASELDALRAENARLRALVSENEALKAALGYEEREGIDAVLARVLSKTSTGLFHGLIIDKGAEDGLVPGQPAVAGDGVIIGTVHEVRRRTASILLLSDSRSSIAVAVQNRGETLGALDGDRGLSMAITLIPQTEKLSPGDTVITSGIEPLIRRGLVVGTIEKVVRNNQDPFQSATVVPFPTTAHPTFVQVLRVSED
jgi:rod shape-determining protein MreC